MVSKKDFVLTTALCVSLLFNVFSREFRILFRGVALSVVCAVIVTILCIIVEGFRGLWNPLSKLLRFLFHFHNKAKANKEAGWNRFQYLCGIIQRGLTDLDHRVEVFVTQTTEVIHYLDVKAEKIVPPLIRQGVNFVRAARDFLTENFRYLAIWIKSKLAKDDASNGPPPPPCKPY
jgi:hypothetical protein